MIPRWKAEGLARVMDSYGKYHYVRPEALANEARTLLRRYSPITGLAYGFEDEPKQSAHLHRGNICTHGKAAHSITTVLGDSFKTCSRCEAECTTEATT